MTEKTILVVDTDTETTQQIVAILEAEDYLVFTAPNKDIGLAMAKKVGPSLVFVNPDLSGASGLEVCKAIHGAEQLKDIPLVILSVLEGGLDPRYAEVYGIVDSLAKPFSREELISKTENILSGNYGDIQAGAFQEFSAGKAEEPAGFGAAEETVIMKPQPIEKFETSEKTMVKMEEEIPEPFENTQVENISSVETEKAYKFKTSLRRRGMRSRLFVPLIVALVIIAIIGAVVGFMLYKESLIPWLKPSATAPAKPAVKEAAVALKPKEEGKPVVETAESKPPAGASAVKPAKPIEKPSAVKTAPAAKAPAKAEVKPAAKGAYHVQIGAFKNSANADALAKQLQGKGYEAFVQKGTKGKEAIHRVLIGKYENVKEASKMAKKITAKENMKAVVLKD